MAEDQIQGALSSIEPTEAPDIASKAIPSDPVTAATEKYMQEKAALIKQHQALLASLEERSRPDAANFLLSLSKGFLTPTRGGSFGESLGNVVGEVGQYRGEQQKKENDLAKMRLELGAQQLGMTKEDVNETRNIALEEAIGGLYRTTKGPYGEDIQIMDPNAAKRISMLTRDPSVATKLVSEARQRKLNEASGNAFKPVVDAEGKTTYQFNPSAIPQILAAGGSFDDVAKIAKSIPDLKKAGLISGLNIEVTPFDALEIMAPTPELKAHVQGIQKRYKAGLIKDEDAEKQAQNILQLMTQHMDKQQQMLFNQSVQAALIGIRPGHLELQRQSAEEKQSQNASRLTDQQKIEYRQVMVPILNEGIKATSALSQLKGIESTISKAPSGVLEGASASSVGALFGTDANTALRELERIQKSLLTQIPRLPGAQSNFDAQNLEKALGRLTDLRLTNKQRIELIKGVKEGFEKLSERAYAAQDYWETNRKIMPELIGGKATEKTIVRTGTVDSGSNKGKRVIEYSDGTREYK